MSIRKPVETFPPGEFLRDELNARGWTTRDLALRIGGDAREVAVNQLALDLLIHVRDPGIYVGEQLAEGLARGLGTTATYWLNLDAAWHRSPA